MYMSRIKCKWLLRKGPLAGKTFCDVLFFSGLNLTITLEKSKILVVPRRLENLHEETHTDCEFPIPIDYQWVVDFFVSLE